ncbi:MAG TPA: hypothetical protein PK821_00330 [Victivallales bacterium]|nr:hypothetical protein [Victivallales bacterium]
MFLGSRFLKSFCLLSFFLLPFTKSFSDDSEVEKKVLDVGEIDEKIFLELRAPYSGRPKPADLVFEERLVEKYLESLPENIRDAEKKRFEIIKGVKNHIIRLFERNTFTIKNGLKLRSGRTIQGTISLANENVFILRKGKSVKGQTYKWDDLSIEGYTEILEQFAEKRLSINAGKVSKEDSRKFAANDYIMLTLLCDWYGEYGLSSQYAKRAVQLRSEIKNDLNTLLFK